MSVATSIPPFSPWPLVIMLTAASGRSAAYPGALKAVSSPEAATGAAPDKSNPVVL